MYNIIQQDHTRSWMRNCIKHQLPARLTSTLFPSFWPCSSASWNRTWGSAEQGGINLPVKLPFKTSEEILHDETLMMRALPFHAVPTLNFRGTRMRAWFQCETWQPQAPQEVTLYYDSLYLPYLSDHPRVPRVWHGLAKSVKQLQHAAPSQSLTETVLRSFQDEPRKSQRLLGSICGSMVSKLKVGWKGASCNLTSEKPFSRRNLWNCEFVPKGLWIHCFCWGSEGASRLQWLNMPGQRATNASHDTK